MSRCSDCTAAVLSGLPYGEVSGRAVSTKLRMRDPARHAPTRPLARGGGRVLPHVGPLPVPEVCHRTGQFHHITAVGPPAIPTRWPPRPGHPAFITLTSLSFPNIKACKIIIVLFLGMLSTSMAHSSWLCISIAEPPSSLPGSVQMSSVCRDATYPF